MRIIAYFNRSPERTLILSGFAREEVETVTKQPGTLLRPYRDFGNLAIAVAISSEEKSLPRLKKSCENNGIHQLIVGVVTTDFESLMALGIQQVCWGIKWNCLEYYISEGYSNIYGAAMTGSDHQTVWSLLFGENDDAMLEKVYAAEAVQTEAE